MSRINLKELGSLVINQRGEVEKVSYTSVGVLRDPIGNIPLKDFMSASDIPSNQPRTGRIEGTFGPKMYRPNSLIERE